MKLDTNDLRDAVVGKLVEKFEEPVLDVMRTEARKMVRESIKTQMDLTVQTIIQEALSKEIQMTTRWGEPDGPPRTMREHLLQEVGRVLTLQVDGYNGALREYKASKFEESLLGFTVRKVAAEVMAKHFTDELTKATVAAKAEIVNLLVQRAKEIADRAAKGMI